MPELRKNALVVLLMGAGLALSALPAAAQDDGLVIGHAAAVTGLLAPYDGPDGVACRIAQINDAGGILGKPVTLLTRDTKSDPVTAANVGQELIDAGADVLLGPPTDDGLIPIAGLALAQGIAVLAVGATQPAFRQRPTSVRNRGSLAVNQGAPKSHDDDPIATVVSLPPGRCPLSTSMISPQ